MPTADVKHTGTCVLSRTLGGKASSGRESQRRLQHQLCGLPAFLSLETGLP